MTPPVLIAGFHRSGTSAVARALHTAGLHLGDELLGAEPANPYGHFEDVQVIAAHDDALRRVGLTWKSPTDPQPGADDELRSWIHAHVRRRARSGRPWAIKDPRLCLFLDHWLDASPTAKVIVVFRRPADAIASLHRRHVRRFVDTRGIDPSDRAFWETPDLGVRLWIHYHEQLLTQLPSADQVIALNFAHRASIENLPATLSQQWDIPVTTMDPVLLDPMLGGETTTSIEVRDPLLIPRTRHIWDQLSALTPKEM